ncbi:chloride channel protein [Terribium terrae]|uniref:chloride channel protein n=1 Tax=Mesorhizobium TaxID=68287 RepID=UPI00338FFE95
MVSGIPGGIFAPSHAVGAVSAARSGLSWAPTPAWPRAARHGRLFRRVVQAPMTAIVTILEMTGKRGLRPHET